MNKPTEPNDTETRKALSERISDLASGLPMEEYLERILTCVTELLQATGGEIAVLDEEKEELEVIASHNIGFDSRGVRLAVGEGAMGLVLQTSESIVISNYGTFVGKSPKYASSRIRAVAAVPLGIGDRLVGALALTSSDSQRRLTERSIASLKDFAALAAIGIESARLQARSLLQSQELLLLAARAELEGTYERMRVSLKEAAKVQWALMPHRPPEFRGFTFGWRFLPCEALGGDGLDIVLLDEDRVGLYLLDVRGHGTAASLLSVTVIRVLSRMREHSLLFEGGRKSTRVLSPAEVARRLNELFPMDAETQQYFTFVYGIVDHRAREFRYVAAGHPGPVQVRRGAAPTLAFSSTGLPIGMVQGADYKEVRIKYAPGDRFYFFSDGMLEAVDPQGKEFGLSRLQSVLQKSSEGTLEESLDAAVAALWAWRTVRNTDDDVSVVGVEMGG